MKPELQIIGIGSPAGDDRLGWEVVQQLEQRLPRNPGIRLLCLDRPGSSLLSHLDPECPCWLVDAFWCPEQPGRYRQPGPDQLADRVSPIDSHGFGLAQSLALAATLGCLPARLELHCLGIGQADPLSRQLSAPVAAAVEQLVQRLLERLTS